jgi:hypothetical protein
MARRASSSPEISLFPFLSILVCVIGALVLLIVIMTLAQSTAGDGRTPEEMQRAMRSQAITRELQALAEKQKKLEATSGEVAPLLKDLAAEQKRLIQLREDLRKLAGSEKPAETDAELQKRLELALQQIKAMDQERPPLDKEIAKLEAELKAKQLVLKAPPALIVQPGGTGNAKNQNLYFVEAGGGGIVLHQKGKPEVRISNGSIGKDEALNQFFLNVKKDNKAMVLFLIREDGDGSFRRAAGLAENTFQLRVGKLPLPGRGAVDLTQFGFPKK